MKNGGLFATGEGGERVGDEGGEEGCVGGEERGDGGEVLGYYLRGGVEGGPGCISLLRARMGIAIWDRERWKLFVEDSGT